MVQMMIDKGVPITDHHADAYLAMAHHADPEKWYPNEPADRTARRVLLSGRDWAERGKAVEHVKRKDLYIASGGYLYMVSTTPEGGTSQGGTVPDDKTYRVRVYAEGIDVVCFGLESVDSALEGHYDRVDDLPDWVKERLAVLMVLDSTPPTGELAGVGRRISESVFWVYAPTTASVASTSA
jgi:hypothetical protein